MTPISLPADIAALGAPFFDGLMDPARGEIAGDDVAIVVAHPDDETIGCGALLGRLKGAHLVMVTDGAPRDLVDAHACGFASAADYASRRLDELRAALAIGGLPERALVRLAIPDQEAALDLPRLAGEIAALCESRGIRILLTHAYEGGHPDHDAAAFAAHAAARLLAARGGPQILVVEMPFYRLNGAGIDYQSFRADGMSLQIAIPLTEREKTRKRGMLAAHQTQTSVLQAFPPEVERFRLAPAHDFTALPNDGQLLYERHDWGMTGDRWIELSRGALAALGLGARP